MRKALRLWLALAALGLAAFALAGAAQAATPALTNPGFEDGTTTGWAGPGFATTNYEGYTAPDGDWFGVVLGGCSTNTLAQTFSAHGGDTLSGWSFFKGNDYLPYTDSGAVQLVISGGGGTTTLFYSSIGIVGSYGGTPWVSWSYTFPATGDYTLQVLSSNAYDCAASSAVGIDLAAGPPPDTTPPTITASATAGGNAYTGGTWTNQDVVVSYSCTDDGSGVASVSPDATISTEGTGQSATGTCTDVAGNSADATFSDIQIDKTAPTVSYSGNAGTYTVDQTVSITCAADDSLSGLVSDTCSDISGPAWSFGLGPHSYSADATDAAGNPGSGSTAFTVTSSYDGLCALIRQLSTSTDVADGLCDKLAAAAAAGVRGQAKTKANVMRAFANQLAAQTGKALTSGQAATVADLAAAL